MEHTMSDDPLRGIDFSERIKPLMQEMVLLDQKRMEEIAALRQQLRGAVTLSDEELHCLICAMAGNFPDRFKPIRLDLLRKLSKARHTQGGQ